MGSSDSDRFAEIALSLRYCTEDQIRRCQAIQRETNENLHIGQSLLREGFLSGDQYAEVLRRMRSGVKKEAPAAAVRPEDDLLGKLAVREGWLTASELAACLQGKGLLSEILVARGHLTPDRVKELLARVARRPMFCRTCERAYTVLSIAQSREITCPECKGGLEEGKLPDQPPPKDSLSTQTFKVVKKSLKGPRRPK